MTNPIIEVDIHGLNRYQAKTKIDSILRKCTGTYRIRIIHGYRSGTELRDMIRYEYAKNPSSAVSKTVGTRGSRN